MTKLGYDNMNIGDFFPMLMKQKRFHMQSEVSCFVYWWGARCSSVVRAISLSSQCSTIGVTKAVVCAILSVGWCI